MGGATGSDIGDGGLIMSVATPAWEGATTTFLVRESVDDEATTIGRATQTRSSIGNKEKKQQQEARGYNLRCT